MKIRKIVKRSLLIFILLLLVTAGVLYLLINAAPQEYKPSHLTPQEKDDNARTFLGRVGDFQRSVERGKPFTWSVSAEQINHWLACPEEILLRIQMDSPVRDILVGVHEFLDSAGFIEPSAALDGDVIAFMVNAEEYDKIVSLDVQFDFPEERKFRMKLKRVRIGRLTVPGWIVKGEISRLKKILSEKSSSDDNGADTSAADNDAQSPINAISAIDEKPISTEIKWGRARIYIDNIDFSGGKLTLDITPVVRRR